MRAVVEPCFQLNARRSQTWRALAAAVLSLGLAAVGSACTAPGSNPEAPGSQDPPSSTADCEELAQAYCEKVDACGPDNPTAATEGRAQCEQRVAADCRARQQAPDAEVTAGALQSCVDHWSTLACEALLDWELGDCRLGRGTRAAGESCRYDEQCAGRCYFHRGSDPCGVCVDEATEGASCEADPDEGQPCGEGLTCVNGECVIRSTVSLLGETCTSASGMRCANTLWCDAGVCAQPKPAGAACSALVDECSLAEGLWCPPDAQTCQPFPIVGEGESCMPEGTGILVCSAGLVCASGSSGWACARPAPEGSQCGLGLPPCADRLLCWEESCLAEDQLMCMGGPVEPREPETPSPLYVEVTNTLLTLECGAEGASLSAELTVRYQNDGDVPFVVNLAPLELELPDATEVTLPVTPASTETLAVGDRAVLEHHGSVTLDDGVCARCGEEAIVHLAFTTDTGLAKIDTMQAALGCSLGSGQPPSH